MNKTLVLTIRKKAAEAGEGEIIYQRELEPLEDHGHAWYDRLPRFNGEVEIILDYQN